VAYPNPIIRVRENDRFINRGCYYDASTARHIFQATDTEAIKVKLDYTDILDGATITIVLTACGLTASSAIASGVVTLTLSSVAGRGDLDVKTTFSDGRIRQDFIRVNNPFCWGRDDYGPVLARSGS
jgi:hypothetical protein